MFTPGGWPPNFSRAELLRSERATNLGVPNEPTPEHEADLRAIAWHVLQPLRVGLGGPIKVTSGYRSPALNAATPGSSKTSQHSLGQAADLVPGLGATFSTRAIFDYIRANLPFDQLIWEYGTAKVPQWVHVSFRADHRREQILRTTGTPQKPTYAPWKA